MQVIYILELCFTFCLFTKADCNDTDLSQVLHEAPQLPLLNAADDLQLSLHYNMCSKIMSYTGVPSFLSFLHLLWKFSSTFPIHAAIQTVIALNHPINDLQVFISKN